MYIKCENPQIILHPYCKERILKYGNYVIRGKTTYLTNYQLSRFYNYFPSKLIHPKSLHITADEIEDCYIIDDTGVLLPMYLNVPCGKCILCKSKKVKDWQTRALVESSTSTTRPLWIGLSYNPEFQPEHGVNKRDAQNFLKRLRIRLDRAGYTHELRYFLCSEYGSDKFRPHYHLILYNFPDMEDQQKYFLLRDAWSKVVSLDEWIKFPDYSRFAKWKLKKNYDSPKYHTIVNNLFLNNEYDKMKMYCTSIRYHVRIGFLYYDSLDGDDGVYRVKYCMKYMYKDSKIPIEIIGKYKRRKSFHTIINHDDNYFNTSWIEHKKFRYGPVKKVRLIRKKYNDTFYLASRKLAVGREWLENNRKFYEKNINVTDVSVCVFGKVISMPLPTYFKNLLYPCISKLVSKEVRDKCKEFNRLLFDRYKISFSQTNKTVQFYRDELQIIDKFKCLNWFTNFHVHPVHRYSNMSESYFRCENIDGKKYIELFNYLKNVNIDSEYIINMQKRKELFTQHLIDIIRHEPEIPVSDLVNKRQKLRRMEKHKAKHLYMSEFVY